MRESNRVEYKRQLNDGLEKEAVAFLNSREGGVIYIGVEDSSAVFGVSDSDEIQLKIKDRLKNNIQPSVMGLFDVIREVRENKDVIRINVASGSEKPYYLKKYGMTDKGCFIRVGSASEPMPQRMIDEFYSRRVRNSIGKIKSPRQDLTFEQLKIYYNEAGFDLGDKFAANLELLTDSKEYNYAGYLLADSNGNSIKVAKYAGLDRVNLIESNEYGYCSLVKAAKFVLDKLDLENPTSTRITYKKRINKRLWDYIALREAVINALIHNNYSNEVPPKFEIFDDRLEITSSGGTILGINEDEFFEGYSNPRNKELMRIFKDLDLVEQLGSGLPRILRVYPKECFRFTANFLRISLPVDKELMEDGSFAAKKDILLSGEAPTISGATGSIAPPEPTVEQLSGGSMVAQSGGSIDDTGSIIDVKINLTDRQMEILLIIQKNNKIGYRDVAKEIGINDSAVKKHMNKLKELGVLKRVGGTRGHWEVLDEN